MSFCSFFRFRPKGITTSEGDSGADGGKVFAFIPRLIHDVYRDGGYSYFAANAAFIPIFPFRPKGDTIDEWCFGADGGGLAVPCFCHTFAAKAAFLSCLSNVCDTKKRMNLPAFSLSVRREIQPMNGVSARTEGGCSFLSPG
jgi:hypothetical protein